MTQVRHVFMLLLFTLAAACSAKVSSDAPAVPTNPLGGDIPSSGKSTDPQPTPAPTPAGPTTGRLKDVHTAHCVDANGLTVDLDQKKNWMQVMYSGVRYRNMGIHGDTIDLKTSSEQNLLFDDKYFETIFSETTGDDETDSFMGLAVDPNTVLKSETDVIFFANFDEWTQYTSHQNVHCQFTFQQP